MSKVPSIGRYTVVGRQSRPEFLQKMGFKRSRNGVRVVLFPGVRSGGTTRSLALSLARSLECAVRGNTSVDMGDRWWFVDGPNGGRDV